MTSVPRTRGDGPKEGKDPMGHFKTVPRTRGDGPNLVAASAQTTSGGHSTGVASVAVHGGPRWVSGCSSGGGVG